eukprot:scaffold11267_cov130-Cylindrotheca_fusiformis.AAC.1
MPILENAVLLEGQEETPLPLWNSMQSISNPNGTLKGIADAVSYYYEHATFLPTPETEDEENNHRIYVVSSLDELKKVLDYVGGPVREPARIKQLLESLKEADLKAPGGDAYETVGPQQLLACIFDAIAGTVIPSFSEIKDSSTDTAVGGGGSRMQNHQLQEE